MLYVLFVFPFVLLILFGYAINFDVHHIKLAVYDRDNSEITRDYLNRLTSSSYFDLVDHLSSEDQIRTDTRPGKCTGCNCLPAGFFPEYLFGKAGECPDSCGRGRR